LLDERADERFVGAQLRERGIELPIVVASRLLEALEIALTRPPFEGQPRPAARNWLEAPNPDVRRGR